MVFPDRCGPFQCCSLKKVHISYQSRPGKDLANGVSNRKYRPSAGVIPRLARACARPSGLLRYRVRHICGQAGLLPMPWFRRNKDTQPKAHKKRRREERRRRGVTAIEKFVVEEIEVGGIPTRPTPAPITAPKPAAAWAEDARLAAAWIGLWTLLVAAALFARSGWPVDETRGLLPSSGHGVPGGVLFLAPPY